MQSTRTFEALLAASQANRRFTTLLLGIFSIVALALAASGICGVIAYSTAQRTQEIGIRMAGASRGDVLVMVLKEGAAIGVVGIAFGRAAAFVLPRSSQPCSLASARDPIIGTRTLGAGCGFVVNDARFVLPRSRLAFRIPNCVRLRADGTDDVAGVVPDVSVDPLPGESARDVAARALQLMGVKSRR